jgi:hypothetical protein
VTKVVLRFGISSLASIHQPGDCVHLMWKIGRHLGWQKAVCAQY